MDPSVEPPSSLVEALTEPLVPPARRPTMSAFPWRAMAPTRFPGHLRDFQWQRGWDILPTRERLARWGVTRISSCPNCGAEPETLVHALQRCVVARTFWTLVGRLFFVTTVLFPVSRGRCPRDLYLRLLVAAGEYVLWRNRCAALVQRRRRRPLWPLVRRLYRELHRHLTDELFDLGQEEFLLHWSCAFVHVERGQVVPRFAGWCF